MMSTVGPLSLVITTKFSSSLSAFEFEAALFENERFIKMDIHTAANIGDEKKVREFVESYGDEKKRIINKQNSKGWTSLMYAAQNGYQGLILYLLQEGAEISLKSTEGLNALMLASICGHTESVAILLENEANVDDADCNKWSPIFYAASIGHRGVVQLLLEKKCAVNITDETKGMSPLMLAVEGGHEFIVVDLLQYGADISLISKSGATAHSLAVQSGNVKIKNAISSHMFLKLNYFPLIDLVPNITLYKSSVEAILGNLGLSKYYPIFEKQGIDLNAFWTLTDKDLKDIGLELLGPRRKITNEILKWRKMLPMAGENEEVCIAKLLCENQNLRQQLTECNQVLENEKTHTKNAEDNLDKCVQAFNQYIEEVGKVFSDMHTAKRHLRENVQLLEQTLISSWKTVGVPAPKSGTAESLANAKGFLDVIDRVTEQLQRQTLFYRTEVSRFLY